MTIRGLQRASTRLLVVSWSLIVLGILVLVFGYSRMAEHVVLYRPPWADAPTTGTKSWLTVGRIALMGVGQLGAATAMVFATRGSTTWERFWRWLAAAAGVKTALECVSLVASEFETMFTVATIVVVAGFVVIASRWWQRGELREHPQLAGAPRLALAASLCLWAAFAVAPRFVG